MIGECRDSPDPIAGIASAGSVVDEALHQAASACRAGVRVQELAACVTEVLDRHGAASAMLGYEDGQGGGCFPGPLAVCINEEISGAFEPGRAVQDGDLVTLDLAVRLRGWCADAARSLIVGGSSAHPERARLVSGSALVTAAGVSALRARQDWPDAVRAMHDEADRHGLVILEGFPGHGIGVEMHEMPVLSNDLERAGRVSESLAVSPAVGRAWAIEPVVGLRDPGFVRSGWVDQTADGTDACFTEVTIGWADGELRVLAGAGGLAVDGASCGFPGHDLSRDGV